MASRGQLGRRLARLEGAVRTTPGTLAAVELVRRILGQPGGADQLADLTEIICLGRTMREFEEQKAKGQAPTVRTL
jgi:hypothetical protein